MADSTTMAAHYDPHAAATKYSDLWQRKNLFVGNPEASGPAFSIVLPPPNVTGSLHMGHALNNVLQDILVRYKKMCGYNVVWIPGADHASIAVHWVLERELHRAKTSRQALGREAFLQKAWEFKETTQQTIVGQQKRLGVACDWSRFRFTMDPGLSRAVRETFVKLYEDGLIYRAERLVNWDPVSQTTVSDLEVVYEENAPAELYHFAYPLKDGSGTLEVATTRPETILGDTAVAVHPDDPRYQHLIGQMLRHPLVNRDIPIVADAVLVDPTFGSGAVKITPAHDFNDFALGERHQLPMINILHKDGTLNEQAGEFAGLTVSQARLAVTAKLAELGLERGRVPHKMNMGRSERSGAVLEPMLSTQWYVKTKSLATPALAAVEHQVTQFVPQTWENTYFAWLRNIQDWCISRQLWWGHRIPVWYCQSCAAMQVCREDPTHCESCGSPALQQDEDVLDTWFSSALWPFSTMGWPDKTADLQRWYPTAVIVTSFDIIFFWIARMMMFGQYLMGQVPFADVYIHALIRDAQGEKMSKTKGNVIDPMTMVEQYGADAFRYTLASLAGPGRDIRWDEARVVSHHKFCNKIWQVFRFVHPHLPAAEALASTSVTEYTSLYDRWILNRLHHVVQSVHTALQAYRFDDAATAIYHFVWNEFCDWYIEIAKTILYDEQASATAKAATVHTLLQVCNAICRLLHPFMPFLTEELWQHLPHTTGCVAEASYPTPEDYAQDVDADHQMAFVIDVVTALRRIRAEYHIAPKDMITAQVRANSTQWQCLLQHARVVAILAKSTLVKTQEAPKDEVVTDVVAGAEIFVPLKGLVDTVAEANRLKKEINHIESDCLRIDKQLANADFVARAPAEVVAEKRQLLQTAKERLNNLQNALQRLG